MRTGWGGPGSRSEALALLTLLWNAKKRRSEAQKPLSSLPEARICPWERPQHQQCLFSPPAFGQAWNQTSFSCGGASHPETSSCRGGCGRSGLTGRAAGHKLDSDHLWSIVLNKQSLQAHTLPSSPIVKEHTSRTSQERVKLRRTYREPRPSGPQERRRPKRSSRPQSTAPRLRGRCRYALKQPHASTFQEVFDLWEVPGSLLRMGVMTVDRRLPALMDM